MAPVAGSGVVTHETVSVCAAPAGSDEVPAGATVNWPTRDGMTVSVAAPVFRTSTVAFAVEPVGAGSNSVVPLAGSESNRGSLGRGQETSNTARAFEMPRFSRQQTRPVVLALPGVHPTVNVRGE
jgi:hypothetical protein